MVISNANDNAINELEEKLKPKTNLRHNQTSIESNHIPRYTFHGPHVTYRYPLSKKEQR